MQIVTLGTAAGSWDGSLSTGEALWLSAAITLGLWTLFGVPAYLVHRRRKRLGLGRVENFYAAALRADTVERRIVVSAAAAAFALLMVGSFIYGLAAVAFHWPEPDTRDLFAVCLVTFNAMLGVFQLRHWRR